MRLNPSAPSAPNPNGGLFMRHKSLSRRRKDSSWLHNLREGLRRSKTYAAARHAGPVCSAQIGWTGPVKPDDPILKLLRAQGDMW
jgi:hypothetical protein